MADMSDPGVTAYVNEVVRPMAERLRAIKVRIDDALQKWNAGIGAICTANLDGQILDGRQDYAGQALTGNDVALLMSQLSAIQAQLNGAGVADVIQKPCVRPIEVSL